MKWRYLRLARIGFAISVFMGLSLHIAVAFYQSRDSNYNKNVVSGGGPAFSGLADVYTSTIAHWGNRAASAARKGNKLWNVCDAITGLTCADWSSDATTGLIVPTNIGGSACNVISCEVAIAYDDSGVLGCSGSTACDLTQTHGSRPVVLLNCVNGIACMTCNGSQSMTQASAITPGGAQPWTASTVAQRTGSTASIQTAFATDQTPLAFFNNSSGVMGGYAGTILLTGSGFTEGVFHSLQLSVTAGAGHIQGDGATPVTGTLGTSALATNIRICTDSFGEILIGAFAEGWFGSGDQNASFNNAHSNQVTTYAIP